MWTVRQLCAELAAGKTTSRALVEASLARIADPAGEGARAFLKVYADTARAEAAHADTLRRAGVVRSPVDGLPVCVKDLYDVAGDVTRAGSRVLEHRALADAPAVARLRAAGAILLGRTNMVEFAFGGLGLNPHYGTPLSPWDRPSRRVPGGSSSGAGVAMAEGMCVMALGSDTRGSVRVPAAFCGVSGFKPTATRVPREGAFPLSYTLDSVGPLANSVECCAAWDALLAGEPTSGGIAALPEIPARLLRLAVPRSSLVEGLDAEVGRAYERSLQRLSGAGVRVEEIDAPVFSRAQALFRDGGLAGPEAWQVHRRRRERFAEMDPRVVKRLELGARFSAADYIELARERAERIREADALVCAYDAVVYPTVAVVPPTLAEVSASDEAYFQWNAKVLHNTGIANVLEGCAATLPCHRRGEAPVGLTVGGIGGTDRRTLAVAAAVQAVIERGR
ncbi:MAG: amidase [Burkholderiales bacterium]|nr:amidase [Burkholderiales bacterium]